QRRIAVQYNMTAATTLPGACFADVPAPLRIVGQTVGRQTDSETCQPHRDSTTKISSREHCCTTTIVGPVQNGLTMFAGLTMRSKSAALMYPDCSAASRSVCPVRSASWAMAEALS